MTDETWGPWIEHDGKGCPCLGEYINGEYGDGFLITGVAGSQGGGAWIWSGEKAPWTHLARYRIRKPRALLDMIERARELDDAPEGPVRAPAKRVDA